MHLILAILTSISTVFTVYNFANPCVGDSESGDDCEAVMPFQFGLILVHC